MYRQASPFGDKRQFVGGNPNVSGIFLTSLHLGDQMRCLLVWLITTPQLNELPNNNCYSDKNKYTNKTYGYYRFCKLH